MRSPPLSTHCEHRARTGAVFGGQNSCGPRQYGAGEDSVPGMLSAELSRGSISVSVSSLSLSLWLSLYAGLLCMFTCSGGARIQVFGETGGVRAAALSNGVGRGSFSRLSPVHVFFLLTRNRYIWRNQRFQMQLQCSRRRRRTTRTTTSISRC